MANVKVGAKKSNRQTAKAICPLIIDLGGIKRLIRSRSVISGTNWLLKANTNLAITQLGKQDALQEIC